MNRAPSPFLGVDISSFFSLDAMSSYALPYATISILHRQLKFFCCYISSNSIVSVITPGSLGLIRSVCRLIDIFNVTAPRSFPR